MKISKTIEIDMGHRVPNHKSKCRNLHGHRYKIEAIVDDKVITDIGSSDEGMVIDFSDLKEILMQYIDKVYDHSMTLYSGDLFAQRIDSFRLKTNFVPFIPTAENLAKHWFYCIKIPLQNKRIKLHAVKVWETPTSTATYQDD